MILSRRTLLLSGGTLAFGAGGSGAYGIGIGIEPMMLDVTRYSLTPPGWPDDHELRISVIADIHACEPFMSPARIRSICELSNSMRSDLVVLLGDFNGGHNFVSGLVLPDAWGEAISGLKARLGVFGILGNHDFWHGAIPKLRGDEGESVRRALRAAGIKVLENEATRLNDRGRPFWIAGLADQIALRIRRGEFRGLDDLPATMRQVTDDAPVLLLAHEPMIFDQVPARVSLTLCGHTHGGQVHIPGIGAPFADSRFGSNHVYGHVTERGRHMIISAGLGESIAPVRFGRPPELVHITLGRDVTA